MPCRASGSGDAQLGYSAYSSCEPGNSSRAQIFGWKCGCGGAAVLDSGPMAVAGHVTRTERDVLDSKRAALTSSVSIALGEGRKSRTSWILFPLGPVLALSAVHASLL